MLIFQWQTRAVITGNRDISCRNCAAPVIFLSISRCEIHRRFIKQTANVVIKFCQFARSRCERAFCLRRAKVAATQIFTTRKHYWKRLKNSKFYFLELRSDIHYQYWKKSKFMLCTVDFSIETNVMSYFKFNILYPFKDNDC